MILRLLILLSLFPSSVTALETDNYIVWDKELDDSSEEINRLLKEEIDNELELINRKYSYLSCRKLTFKIANRFRTYPPLFIFIEDWLVQNLTSDQIYPTHMNYIYNSIYKNTYGIFFRKIDLSPNIQVNNIYFGTDKLSHFTSTARTYLKKYLKMKSFGLSDDQAFKEAIKLGIFKERTILGLKFIGVYSYADLEANFQGFLFYKKMCLNEKETYLAKNDIGKWYVKRYPNIKDYVNPNWDESFNLSFRSPRNWFRTSKVIKKEYCSLLSSKEVSGRMNYYKKILKPSFSAKYINELQSQNSYMAPKVDKTQSVKELCSTN